VSLLYIGTQGLKGYWGQGAKETIQSFYKSNILNANNYHL
jgi:hypothetical protein